MKRSTPLKRTGFARKPRARKAAKPSKLPVREFLKMTGSLVDEMPCLAGPRLRKRNPERSRELRALQFDGGIGHDEWVKKQPCVITGARGVVPAHVVSRGAGGRWYHIVPLTPELHTEQHDIGIESFQRKYKVRLLPIALDLARVHILEVLEAEAAKGAA